MNINEKTGIARKSVALGSGIPGGEYWDRFIRNDRHFEAAKNYIVMNPVKAGLVLQPENWLWGSARLRERKLREKNC